jgi:hypothetical protein
MVISTSDAPTKTAIEARSSRFATDFTGGYWNSCPKTTYSLAKSRGKQAIPATMWVPWVSW